jgi:hypothetical protein
VAKFENDKFGARVESDTREMRASRMMLSLVGLLLLTASAAALWAMLPRAGRLAWAATAPVLQDVIPIGIVAGFATGLIFVIASL